jgi:hypothetical protein
LAFATESVTELVAGELVENAIDHIGTNVLQRAPK